MEPIFYTEHAKIRKSQLGIRDDWIIKALKFGKKIDFTDCRIFLDNKIRVVFGNKKNKNIIISINKNIFNIRCQLIERTLKRQISLFDKIRLENNDPAMVELAEFFLSGELGEKNIKKAIELYAKAAELNNSYAMYRLSQLFSSGKYGLPDQILADKWIQKAAERKSSQALTILGQNLLQQYIEANNLPFNYNLNRKKLKMQILRYLNDAKGKGNLKAFWHLGYIYEEGLFGEKNLSNAINSYTKAASIGHFASLKSLHDLTLKSKFDCLKFEEILDRLLSLTDRNIGLSYKLSRKQITDIFGHNQTRGLKMMEKLAYEQFYDKAIIKIAKCYQDGVICTADFRITQYWYYRLRDIYQYSAKEGNINSLWELGKLYMKGCLGDVDVEKAESCFKEVVEKSYSNPTYMYNLGMFYLRGLLGDKPIDEGIILIRESLNIMRSQIKEGITEVYYHLGNYTENII